MIEKALHFSLDQKITWKQLQSDSSNNFTQIQIKWIQSYINDNAIYYCSEDKENYHYKFHNILSKPKIIYYIGDISLLNKQILWVVWPRVPSSYGIEVSTDLLNRAKVYDLATISWWAEWIDILCHELSIHNNIPTIVVLWWWLHYYLNNKKALLQKVIKNWWLILSEYKIFSKPERYTFPQRNRIIAWLSDYLFIPEASNKSWSLITVDYCNKQWKQAYGTPWDIYRAQSEWLHQYINKQKVIIIPNIHTFLHERFATKYQNTPADILVNSKEITGIEKKVFDLCSQKPLSFEYIRHILNIDLPTLSSILSLMQIEWYIKEVDIWYFQSN